MRLGENADAYRGTLIPPGMAPDGYEDAEAPPFTAGEPDWRQAGADDPRVAIAAAVASV